MPVELHRGSEPDGGSDLLVLDQRADQGKAGPARGLGRLTGGDERLTRGWDRGEAEGPRWGDRGASGARSTGAGSAAR